MTINQQSFLKRILFQSFVKLMKYVVITSLIRIFRCLAANIVVCFKNLNAAVLFNFLKSSYMIG